MIHPGILLLISFFLVSGALHAQETLKFGDTNTTNKAPTYKSNKKDFKQKPSVFIFKNSSKGLLLGNRCMEEFTQELGVEYLVQIKGQPGYKSGLGRQLHNLSAKTRLTLTKGPFWKAKVNKKRRDCRRQTADFMG
jgi:hypothetical protein